jgi:predicted amidohydrolase YtcJ
MRAVPAPTPAQLDARLRRALATLAAAGYVAVHEAGADSALLDALTRIDAADPLPVRVVVYLAARDTALIDAWRPRGPWTSASGALAVRGVKAFYDGAMGSRGAYLLADYSDRPGHRGTGGADYGFDTARMVDMMRAGFQLMIHAIGDRANREALDLIERTLTDSPDLRRTRPRIEHAQVLHPSDVPRFGQLGVIASMQPSHAVEDMAWAEDRIGAERLAGAYAWRSIRRAGGRLTLNSDLPGTDYDVFYGLHSAITRRDRSSQPEGGWRPQERLTIDEAMRGWTRWAAWAGFEEERAGVIAVRRPADLTVLSLDPFSVGDLAPPRLLQGQVLMTLSGGRIVHARR